MSRHLALGVIGHVDHGKTSLVRALTGIETDRLKEERERGMSIVLGFAYLHFGDGMIDLIDVPGHEQFVRTMVAGASGIDAALLVVDLREGCKPQTMEHLAITQLLGIRRGVVAVTKSDLGNERERHAAADRLRQLLAGSYLESAPLVFTSAASGEGIAELKTLLHAMLQPRPAPPSGTPWQLPIDRAFSMPGRGTVVTGTLRGGALRVGDEVELLPSGVRSRVRAIEFHRRQAEVVWPGQRAGINLPHVTPEQAARGTLLAMPGILMPSTRLDVQFTLLPEEGGVRDNERLRLLIGTADIGVQIRFLPPRDLAAGNCGFAQLQLPQPVAAAPGELFILRRESPPRTVGGGRVLDAQPPRHRRQDPALPTRLQALAQGAAGELGAAVIVQLQAASYEGIHASMLAQQLGLQGAQALPDLTTHASRLEDGRLLYQPFLTDLSERLMAALTEFHRTQPRRVGAGLAFCRASLPRDLPEVVFQHVLTWLIEHGRLERSQGLVRRAGYDPFATLGTDELQLLREIDVALAAGGLTPPDLESLTSHLPAQQARELLYLLAQQGRLVLLPLDNGRKLGFHRDALRSAIARLRSAFPPPQGFTVSQARALLNSTRKFMVPLMEYWDAQGITVRQGDRRVLVEAATTSTTSTMVTTIKTGEAGNAQLSRQCGSLQQEATQRR